MTREELFQRKRRGFAGPNRPNAGAKAKSAAKGTPTASGNKKSKETPKSPTPAQADSGQPLEEKTAK